MLFIAWLIRYRLIRADTTVAAVGRGLLKPSEYFIPRAKPISNRPASSR
jgi:hypothetical protein